MDMKGIWKRVSELVADPYQTWAKFENFTGTTNQRYEDLYQKLGETDFPIHDKEVVLPGVAAGVFDLSAYATSGKPLERLALPEKLWWKQAGEDDTNYTEVPYLDVEPDVMNTQGVEGWTFRAGVVYVTPSTIAMDVRLLGEFYLPELTSPDDPVRMSGINNILAYLIAAALGAIRGNDKWAVGYEKTADQQLDLVARKLVKNAQNTVRRVGRMSRRGRSRRRLHPNNIGG